MKKVFHRLVRETLRRMMRRHVTTAQPRPPQAVRRSSGMSEG
jgi:hypothetical protein